MRWRERALALVLLAQGGLVAYEQVGASRYFCWAPLHEQAPYRISVRFHGRALTPAEVEARYPRNELVRTRDGARWELNAIEHVFDTVRLREAGLRESERATVEIVYASNGRASRTWRSPE